MQKAKKKKKRKEKDQIFRDGVILGKNYSAI